MTDSNVIPADQIDTEARRVKATFGLAMMHDRHPELNPVKPTECAECADQPGLHVYRDEQFIRHTMRCSVVNRLGP